MINILMKTNMCQRSTKVFIVSKSPYFCFVQCLCIAPTYELALQIGKNVEDMGKFMKDLKIIYAVRGERCE